MKSTTVVPQLKRRKRLALMPTNYKIFRKMILKSLSKFTSGIIHYKDWEQEHRFGSTQSEFEITLTIHNKQFFKAIILGGGLGAAESYIRGDWECDDLTKLFRLFIQNQDQMNEVERTLAGLARVRDRVFNRITRNTIGGSKRNILAHYDLSNEFYQLWLDPSMTYSAGVFKTDTSTMEEASLEKLERMCQILDLQPDDHLLEIGTGWGSLALYAAKNYGCRITTTTISENQFKLAKSRIHEAGLENKITLIQEDYRHLKGQYDKVISIEMIEAVGHEFIPNYVAAIDRLVKPGGKVAIQGITINDQIYDTYRHSVDFIKKYIFPGGNLLSVNYFLQTVATHSTLRPIHLSEIGLHYARTLQCWRKSFESVLPQVRQLGFDEPFIRLWRYYLTYCEAGFLEKHIGNVQLGFEKR
jgi:cyclopropane-fatty-acyl-phospholipid synthase